MGSRLAKGETVSFSSQNKQVADENHKKLVEMLGIWKSENEATNKSTEEVMKKEVGKVPQILSEEITELR